MLDANATPGADTIVFNIPGSGVHTITPATPLPTCSSPSRSTATRSRAPPQHERDGRRELAPGSRSTAASPATAASRRRQRRPVPRSCHQPLRRGRSRSSTLSANATGIVVSGNFSGPIRQGLVLARDVTVRLQRRDRERYDRRPDPADRNLISGNCGLGHLASGNFNGGSRGPCFRQRRSACEGRPRRRFPNGSASTSTGRARVGKHRRRRSRLRTSSRATPAAECDRRHVPSSMADPRQRDPRQRSLGIDLNVPAASQLRTTRRTRTRAQPPAELSDHSVGHASAGARRTSRESCIRRRRRRYDLDFYANPACSNFPREFLEGQTYIGSAPVTTDGSGTAVIDVTLPVAVDAGARIIGDGDRSPRQHVRVLPADPLLDHADVRSPAGGSRHQRLWHRLRRRRRR